MTDPTPIDSPDDLADGAVTRSEVVPHSAAGRRFDAVVAELFPEYSRTRLSEWIKAGDVLLDGAQVRGRDSVRGGETASLDVVLDTQTHALPQDIPIEVLYEDADVFVINKPAGLVVHPGAGNHDGTLVNALLFRDPSLSTIPRAGIVHRLDKDTTGLMVVAKTDRAHAGLAAQFADHGRTGPLERGYLALVWGVPEPFRGTIAAALGRSSADRTKMAVIRGGGGKEAITHYEVVERFPAQSGRAAVASLIECHLETGRTHQIRVHMTTIGHPLIGDQTYGTHFLTKANRLPDAVGLTVRQFPRQALHAFLIAFEHPVTGEALRFESPLPQDMDALVAAFADL